MPERIKIEKVQKLVANLYDNTDYGIHMKNLKQASNHGLFFLKKLHIFEELHTVIKFKQKAWLSLHRYEHRSEKKSKH